MKELKERYIIVEVIPTGISKEKGILIQISALKLKDLMLEDRFDCRLREDLILNEDFKDMLSYDKDKFKYLDNDKLMIEEFREWSEGLPLLILDNQYTRNFLSDLENEKESICDYLDIEYSDDLIDKLMKKYDIEPTNYIVDIMFESLIKRSN